IHKVEAPIPTLPHRDRPEGLRGDEVLAAAMASAGGVGMTLEPDVEELSVEAAVPNPIPAPPTPAPPISAPAPRPSVPSAQPSRPSAQPTRPPATTSASATPRPAAQP